MVETHYSTPSNRQGLSWVLLMGLIGLMWGCQSSGGTLVTMTLNLVVTQSEVGKHYEVFAAINDGVVSLRRFDVQLIPIGSGSFIKSVVDYDNPDRELGVVDGVDQFGRFISGVRFRISANLRGATQLFVTIEDNEDDHPGPSTDVLMLCDLEPRSADILSCVMLSPLDKQFVLGTAALVLPDESWE